MTRIGGRTRRSSAVGLFTRTPWILGIIVVLLTVPLASGGVGPIAVTPPHPSSPRPAGPALRASLPPGAGSVVPGSQPASERSIDGPWIALQAWEAQQNSSRASNGTPASPGPRVGPSPVRTDPLPASINGTVTGRIYDLTHGRPVTNATVSIQPFGSTYCSPTCASIKTDSAGDFTLPAPAGTVVVIYSAPYYVNNRTWATVAPGGTDLLGTLYLVHDGYASGMVEANTPDHSPIAGVQLNSTSRDGTVVGNPGALTPANGSFTVAVPPLPSFIALYPPSTEFEPNTTYANVTPYQTIDLGVIYLEGGIRANATLVDSVTGLPISDATPSSMVLCNALTSCNGNLGGVGAGPNVSAFGLPGPAILKVAALGYMDNTTQIPNLPNTDQTVQLGSVELVPYGAFEISSNLTGGPAPPSGWAMPTLSAVVCSLSGVTSEYSGGWAPSCTGNDSFTVGQTTLIAAPPLEDVIILTAGDPVPSFPISNNLVASETWLPLWPKEYVNASWANATPDRVTDLGSVDLTPGTYVTGNVSIAGVTGSLDGAFEAQVCSTDVPTMCGLPVLSSDEEATVLGCPTASWNFCAPAPPGPDEITVTRIGPGLQNRTWVEVPRGCCGQDGHPLSVGWINLTVPAEYGHVNGSVAGQIGGPGSSTVPLSGSSATVQSCPLSPPPLGLPSVPCTDGAVEPNGSFSLNASLGWDIVSAFSTTYQSNWTWIDVTGNNSSGVIELAPKAEFIGQVVSPGGGGLYSAIISACPIGTPSECFLLGTTNSFGQFNGSAPGGPLPWGTYEITASSSGYATSWTYVNSTPGALTVVPTFTLDPVGSSAHAPVAVAGANGSVGAWVDGRLVDSTTGLGVVGAELNECLVTTGGCTGGLFYASFGGTFNVSLLTGQYYLEVNASGYAAANLYVNATTNVVHLGTIDLEHLPWVHGRVLIAPWQSLGMSYGLGAPVFVVGCPPLSTTYSCGPSTFADSGGFFNVSVPVSGSSQVEFFGRGVGTWGSPQWGFQPATLTVAATQTYVNLPTSGPSVPSVGIFGSITGRLADGSTWNSTDHAARDPCAFCIVTVTVIGSPTVGYFLTQTGGGGNYTTFEPSDGTSTLIVGTAAAYWGANETLPGSVAAAVALSTGPIDLPHYGWVNVRVVDGNSSSLVAFFHATAIVLDPGNSTSFQTLGTSRDDGFLNQSVPVGAKVTINVTASGYGPTNRTFSVLQSQTVQLGTLRITPGGSVGVWFRSVDVNTVNTTPFSTVVDGLTHAPLPGASVSTTTSLGVATTTVYTNGIGQFLTLAPPQPNTGLYAHMPGYEVWVFHWVTANVSQVSVASMNVTGDGIVAGRVVTEPGGLPVYDTEVDVCPVSTSCTNEGLTNATGVFWVTAPPGADTVSVVSNSFLTNVTDSLTVSSDAWSWVGTIPIYQFATITGTLRGLPYGNLLTTANASVCSVFVAPGASCTSTVPTDANGSFQLPVPPGVYLLQFQSPGYNTTYLPVDPQPGQSLSIGTIFLLEFGEILGRVVSTISGNAISNATVYACAVATADLCSAYAHANATGAFALAAPPGNDLLTSTAAGYFDNYTTVYVPTGGSTSPLTVALLPLSVAIPESIAGTVVAANQSNAPIPGAFVSADLQGVPVGSGSTDSAGRFSLAIDWGTYSIVASAPGYAPVRESLVVHTNLSGLVLALPTMTYTVSGTVTDSLTGHALGAVAITDGTTRLAVSSATGAFSFQLANGSYSLVAGATSATGGTYESLPFTVSVIGRGVARAIELTESSGAVSGVVVDADSGLPIPTATISVFGAGSATRVALVGVSGTGAFSVALSPGGYVLNVSAPGYASTSLSVQVPSSSGPLDVALSPVGAAGGLSATVPLPLVVGALAGILIAAVIVTVWWRRRPPPPAPIPRWTLEDVQEPGADAP